MATDAMLTAVRERGILFSGEMVRKIYAGEKTQTRRPIPLLQKSESWRKYAEWEGKQDGEHPLIKRCLDCCPYGQPGNRLWVRETFQCFYPNERLIQAIPKINPRPGICLTAFKATEADRASQYKSPEWTGPWRPSIHMPRWASRITLDIKNVRVERIQDITLGDAVAEGMITSDQLAKSGQLPSRLVKGTWAHDIVPMRWQKVYPGSWNRNDWVWVIEFRKVS